MPIPINPAFILNPVNVPLAPASQPCSVWDPPSEGVRTISFQLDFSQALNFLVDPSALGCSSSGGMSKISSIFLDNSTLNNTTFIYFPDSGYSAVISPGNTLLIPIISNQPLPKFYVVRGGAGAVTGAKSGLAVAPHNLLSIILINKLVPLFNTAAALENINTGMTDFYNTFPVYNMNNIFAASLSVPGSVGTFSVNIINHTAWFVKGCDISILGNTGDMSTSGVTCTLLDNGVAIMTKNIIFTPTLQFFQVFDFNEINYQSKNSGALSFTITGGAANIALTAEISCFGGILTL